jgi:serine/threonine-protein kinase ATR
MVPEIVPFRLTHNLIDAMGFTGVEGKFRKSCETTLDVLIKNRYPLFSVFRTLVNDPLSEWSKATAHVSYSFLFFFHAA